MDKKRPQLSLSELYQLKWIMGGALALLSAWTVLYMDVEASLWLVLITVAVPIVLRWPSLTLRVPRWAHRLAFPLFVALFATDFYLHRDPLPAMIRLALMLVFYRAITPRKRRDDLQLIVLGLFLVVVAGVISVSLAFAPQILLFTACTLVFLLLITLIDSAEAGQSPVVGSAPTTTASTEPPAWMRSEWRRLARRLREATDWRVAMLASGLFTGVLAFSALLFFALPRFEIGNSFFLDNLMRKESKTGFSENVRFGDVTKIQEDTSVALRVEVSDPRAIPDSPYWRMLVLDSYEDGQFGTSRELANQMLAQKRKASTVTGSSRPRSGDVMWTFYLEGGLSRYLPLLGSFRQVQFNGGSQDYAINDEYRMLRLERTPAKMFAYRVEGMRYEATLGKPEIVQWRESVAMHDGMPEDQGDRNGSPLLPPTFLNLSLGEADLEKLSGWVRAIDAPPGDATAFAARASRWLAQNHSYSLQMNIGPGDGDQLVRWMASSEPGHCELFAGAFTVLARSAGYPTRMVTGFRGGTWNAGSNHLSIRNSDAHAWCEIFDEKVKGWVRVDPTPGNDVPTNQPGVEEDANARLARISDSSWSSKLDGVRMFWYRRIVDFDQNTQAELARDAKNAIQSRAKKLKELINERLKLIGDWLQEPWDVARLVAWVAVVGTGFGVVLGWRLVGRGWWLRWRSGMTRNGVDPVRREAGRWLRRIATHSLNADDPEAAQVLADLKRLRYGPRQSWPNPQGAFRRAKRACK